MKKVRRREIDVSAMLPSKEKAKPTVRKSLPYMGIGRRLLNGGPLISDAEIEYNVNLLISSGDIEMSKAYVEMANSINQKLKNDGYIEPVKPIKRKFNVIDRKGK